MIKFSRKTSAKKILEFFKKKKLFELLRASKEIPLRTNQTKKKKPYRPELNDLYSLYKIITDNKRITSLELGSGWSSLIIALALQENQIKYKSQIRNLRVNNPFKNYSVDNEKKYLGIAKKRIIKYDKNLRKNNFFIFSKAKISKYNFRYVTEFVNLPKINPDFIYIDGPDQYKLTASKDTFNIDRTDLTPMSADVLKIEFFLNPGTIILIDGRGANSNFLRKNLQRKWKYKYLKYADQHLFFLIDKPYGIHSDKLFKFFKKK